MSSAYVDRSLDAYLSPDSRLVSIFGMLFLIRNPQPVGFDYEYVLEILQQPMHAFQTYVVAPEGVYADLSLSPLFLDPSGQLQTARTSRS